MYYLMLFVFFLIVFETLLQKQSQEYVDGIIIIFPNLRESQGIKVREQTVHPWWGLDIETNPTFFSFLFLFVIWGGKAMYLTLTHSFKPPYIPPHHFSILPITTIFFTYLFHKGEHRKKGLLFLFKLLINGQGC